MLCYICLLSLVMLPMTEAVHRKRYRKNEWVALWLMCFILFQTSFPQRLEKCADGRNLAFLLSKWEFNTGFPEMVLVNWENLSELLAHYIERNIRVSSCLHWIAAEPVVLLLRSKWLNALQGSLPTPHILWFCEILPTNKHRAEGVCCRAVPEGFINWRSSLTFIKNEILIHTNSYFCYKLICFFILWQAGQNFWKCRTKSYKCLNH